MRRVVIDAATFVGWFTSDPVAGALRREFEGGQLAVVVPTGFVADVLGRAAQRGWSADRLERLAGAVADVGFEIRDPSPAALARWLVRGLSPSEAAYAALAEETERPLVAGDPALAQRTTALPRL